MPGKVHLDSGIARRYGHAMNCRLKLRVVPNAKRSELVGAHGDAVRVKVAAPALDGRANEALVEFIAETLNISRREVRVVTGEKSRDKLIEIDGLDEAEARKRLS